MRWRAAVPARAELLFPLIGEAGQGPRSSEGEAAAVGLADRLPPGHACRVSAQPVAADHVAAALASTWGLLAGTLSTGWVRQVGRATALVTGVPVASLNGVWVTDPRTTPADIEAGLAAVSESGVRHCVQLRPGSDAAANDVPERYGMVPQPAIPLMATADLIAGRRLKELIIRELAPAEAWTHCEIAGPAFGAPVDLLAQLLTPTVLGLPAVRSYAGEVSGEAVVTAVSVTVLDMVGIFNVATLAAYRRRGYAAAVTARAFQDGLRAGATCGWLQSSDAGYGVYERLGFSTIERWACWITP